MYKGSDLIIDFLSRKKDRGVPVKEIADATKLHIDTVRRALEWLRDNGHVKLDSITEDQLSVTEEFKKYSEGEFPEVSVYMKAKRRAPLSALSAEEKQYGLRWAKIKGYADIENGLIVPLKNEEDIRKDLSPLKEAYLSISQSGKYEDRVVLEELFRRRLVERRVEKKYIASYTGKPLEGGQEFDMSVESRNAEVGRQHPLSTLTKRIKRIFADLGFEEMSGDIVETAFWNFDALFQPQDHPARDMADTFYLEGTAGLPDKKLVERVKKSHESGWKYTWSESEAKRLVLRTHTTALSARHLAANYGKRQPKKYFAIGRVFRNEATDYKHLAEFHQVEGIIAWEHATFRDLLGIIKEFYAKLGFEKIRFRPSFFPYTEPSLEVEMFYGPRKQWLEIGGAGIFRPEVSVPLAGVYPVLAWGLSLERPLMLMLNVDDIRAFYRNDLEFLRKARL